MKILKNVAKVFSVMIFFMLAGCTGTKKSAEVTDADYSKYFNGINGCAAVYDFDSSKLYEYNKELCAERYSPFSTFKIYSTLIGLKYGVLTSPETKMGYSGSNYEIPSWNADLTLQDAFKNSCVWYYRKVIDKIGIENMQKELNYLNFGNCDISEWNGNSLNSSADTNGFWLSSSLKVSPLEQVKILASIFENKTNYKKSDVEMLKNLMCFEQAADYSIYGKTGTGRNNEGWFAGFMEKGGKRYYFAVFMHDSSSEMVSGATARNAATGIVKDNF